MSIYADLGTRNKPTHQKTKAKTGQVKNSENGFVFRVTDEQKLLRFLILGSEGGSYYASPKKLTKENSNHIINMIKDGQGVLVASKAIEISKDGRARKNDQALYAMALVLTYGTNEEKAYVVENLHKVARIGTHLFEFASMIKSLRGWGTTVKAAFAKWYDKPLDKLTFQMVKYRNRNGWNHKDLLRLNHITPLDNRYSALYKYAITGEISEELKHDADFKFLKGFELAKMCDNEKEIISIINEYRLTEEMIGTEFRTSAKVQKALLQNLGLTAIIRSLGKFTASGLISNSDMKTLSFIEDKLTNAELIKKSRVHPLQLLDATLVYASGSGVKGNLTWKHNQRILDALDEAFYLSFGNVESTGKNIMLALDVSGSMTWSNISGSSVLTPRTASAAMAMVTARTERNYVVTAFAGGGNGGNGGWGASALTELNISPKMDMPKIIDSVKGLDFRGTDCALPMMHAIEKKMDIDTFIVYCVDEETEILTSEGWKSYDNLKENEELYTLNHENGNGEWQNASSINIFPKAKRKMLHIEGRGHSSLSTANHRWPVKNRTTNKSNEEAWGRRWKTSETLNKVDYIQCSAQDSNLPVKEKWSNSFVELLAWIYTEGYISPSKSINFSQSHKANPRNVEKIRLALNDYLGASKESLSKEQANREWREDCPKEDMTVFYINKKGSSAFINLMENDKSIKLDWFRELTKEQLNLFIHTSMIADGHLKKNRFCQKEESRSNSFAFACILAGHSVSYTKIDNAHHKNYLEIGILKRSQFAPLQNSTNKDNRPFKAEWIEHDGIVWCPTTPNKTWLARRKGSIYWTGNTDSETYSGKIHPFEALKRYRNQMNKPNAQLIVVGMVSNDFTIADPSDAGMMDFVGFDTGTPRMMTEFIKGNI